MFDTIRSMYSKNIAFVSVLLWLIIPAEIILPQFLYHETALLIFMPMAIWCAIVGIPKAKKTISKILMYCLFFVFLFIGSAMSPLGIVYSIAIIICALLKALQKREKTYIIRSGLIVLLTVAALMIKNPFLNLIKQPYVSGQVKSEGSSGMIAYTIFSGSNYKTGGEWTQEEYDTILEYVANNPDADMGEYYYTRAKENYSYLFNHPGELIKFFATKFEKIWNSKYAQDSIASAINTKYQKIGLLTSSFSYIIQALLALIAFASVSFKRYKYQTDRLIYPLLIIGFSIVLLILEACFRYFVHFQLFVIFLGVIGIKDFCERGIWLKDKIKTVISDHQE